MNSLKGVVHPKNGKLLKTDLDTFAEDQYYEQVMLNFPKAVLMKKQAHLHLGWPEGE